MAPSTILMEQHTMTQTLLSEWASHGHPVSLSFALQKIKQI